MPVPPPPVPDTRQVRRAQLRRNEFERFGYTDSCPGCANATAGSRQAVDHSEQCRSRMDTILLTTTKGQMRMDQVKERFRWNSARDIVVRASASGEVHRVCTYACCGCGDSSSCAVSAASVVVYIATLLAEFWELASDAHAAPASMAEYTFSFCGVCGTRSTCTQRQQHRQVIVFVGQAPRESRGEFSVLRCGDIFYFQHCSGRALEGRAVRQGHGTAITAGVELGGSPWRSSSNWSLTYRPRDRDDGRTC